MSVRVLTGDCRDVLPTLAAGSVHCVVTSPPYFNLRDYGHAGQIGLEASPDEFVAAMVEVFREVRRVLRDDGVAWLVLGDSYASTAQGTRNTADFLAGGGAAERAMLRPVVGLDGGNMLGIPWRTALALQADGWTLRQAVTWAKVAPMPESVAGTRWERCRVKTSSIAGGGKQPTNAGSLTAQSGGTALSEWADCPGCPRCAATDGYVLRRGSWRHTSATEMVFMLTKGMAYWANQEAVREPNSANSHGGQPIEGGPKQAAIGQQIGGAMGLNFAGRNPRNWVTPSPSPFPGAHFATFSPHLIEPFIKATCPAKCCPTCGAGWAPVVERGGGQKNEGPKLAALAASGIVSNGTNGSTLGLSGSSAGWAEHGARSTVLGYRPTCSCPLAAPVPGTCLDPFAGAGTTLLVADRLGLNGVGIELNPAYAEMAERRIYADAPLFAEVLS